MNFSHQNANAIIDWIWNVQEVKAWGDDVQSLLVDLFAVEDSVFCFLPAIINCTALAANSQADDLSQDDLNSCNIKILKYSVRQLKNGPSSILVVDVHHFRITERCIERPHSHRKKPVDGSKMLEKAWKVQQTAESITNDVPSPDVKSKSRGRNTSSEMNSRKCDSSLYGGDGISFIGGHHGNRNPTFSSCTPLDELTVGGRNALNNQDSSVCRISKTNSCESSLSHSTQDTRVSTRKEAILDYRFECAMRKLLPNLSCRVVSQLSKLTRDEVDRRKRNREAKERERAQIRNCDVVTVEKQCPKQVASKDEETQPSRTTQDVTNDLGLNVTTQAIKPSELFQKPDSVKAKKITGLLNSVLAVPGLQDVFSNSLPPCPNIEVNHDTHALHRQLMMHDACNDSDSFLDHLTPGALERICQVRSPENTTPKPSDPMTPVASTSKPVASPTDTDRLKMFSTPSVSIKEKQENLRIQGLDLCPVMTNLEQEGQRIEKVCSVSKTSRKHATDHDVIQDVSGSGNTAEPLKQDSAASSPEVGITGVSESSPKVSQSPTRNQRQQSSQECLILDSPDLGTKKAVRGRRKRKLYNSTETFLEGDKMIKKTRVISRLNLGKSDEAKTGNDEAYSEEGSHELFGSGKTITRNESESVKETNSPGSGDETTKKRSSESDKTNRQDSVSLNRNLGSGSGEIQSLGSGANNMDSQSQGSGIQTGSENAKVHFEFCQGQMMSSEEVRKCLETRSDKVCSGTTTEPPSVELLEISVDSSPSKNSQVELPTKGCESDDLADSSEKSDQSKSIFRRIIGSTMSFFGRGRLSESSLQLLEPMACSTQKDPFREDRSLGHPDSGKMHSASLDRASPTLFSSSSSGGKSNSGARGSCEDPRESQDADVSSLSDENCTRQKRSLQNPRGQADSQDADMESQAVEEVVRKKVRRKKRKELALLSPEKNPSIQNLSISEVRCLRHRSAGRVGDAVEALDNGNICRRSPRKAPHDSVEGSGKGSRRMSPHKKVAVDLLTNGESFSPKTGKEPRGKEKDTSLTIVDSDLSSMDDTQNFKTDRGHGVASNNHRVTRQHSKRSDCHSTRSDMNEKRVKSLSDITDSGSNSDIFTTAPVNVSSPDGKETASGSLGFGMSISDHSFQCTGPFNVQPSQGFEVQLSPDQVQRGQDLMDGFESQGFVVNLHDV